MKLNKFPVLLIFIVLFLSVSVHASSKVEVHDAWVADAPPVAKIRAGYLTIVNNKPHTIIISSFSSPDFTSIEIHRTFKKGGMVGMEQIDGLRIKSGQKIELVPGGKHLMMFNPKRKFKKGDNIKITIHFANGKTSQFTATVRERGNNN